MSEFKIEVVAVGPVEKHPNADSLGITKVYDFPVIVRLGEFKEGDKAIYVPVDAVVPLTDPRFSFLEKGRIKAKRLRGVFSMGLLVPADPTMDIGKDVAEALCITKYEQPPSPAIFGGDCVFDPGMPKYTDIESLRRYPKAIEEGEEVVMTEKIHGTNFRAGYVNGDFFVGSHKTIKKENPNNLYWKAAIKNNLREALRPHPNKIVYGEIYGYIQDLHYGMKQNEFDVRYFDVLDLTTMKYLDHDEAYRFLNEVIYVSAVPVLYRGPFKREQLAMAEAQSRVGPGITEGLVIKPVAERFSYELNGRCIVKHISEAYLTRKGGTEFH